MYPHLLPTAKFLLLKCFFQQPASEIAPDKIELALNAADVRRINGQGKKVALMGVENGYPIGDELVRVKEFYDRGARYLSLTHNGHNQLADSQTGERDGWKWNGLSPLGKQVIAEMNRLGIMVDVAHASKESMMQTAALSKAPIIASHSAARALCDVSRNMDDEQLLALNEALELFAAHDARKTELVKLRFFAGLTNEQAAQVLGISTSTADNDWAYARSWLRLEIGGGSAGDAP